MEEVKEQQPQEKLPAINPELPEHKGLPNSLRKIYIVIIALLLIGVAFAFWQYKKANDDYKAQQAGLQKIWDDHEQKVKDMESNKKPTQ